MTESGRNSRAEQLLVALSRPRLVEQHVPRTQQLGQSATSHMWLYVAERAKSLRTAPWVWHHADQLGLDLPDEASTLLKNACRAIARKTIAADVLLDRLVPLLVGDQPPAMLIKGSVIEQRVYPQGLMRPQVDIDIVACPGRMAYIVERLYDEGFTHAWTTRSGHEIGLADPSAPSVVEIHRTILCPYRFAPFADAHVSRWLFERAQRDRQGRLVPHDVDHTAFLLVHLVELIYADMRHVADAATWLRCVQVDPAAVWAVACEWQAQRALAAGLGAVQRFDPGALGVGWRSVIAAAPRDAQSAVAAGLRAWVADYQLRRGRQHPRWMEGIGLALHLDRPLWFFGSYVRDPPLHKAVR